MRKANGLDWSVESLLKKLDTVEKVEVTRGGHMKKKLEALEIDDGADATVLLESRLQDLICNSVTEGTRESYARKARVWADFCCRRRLDPFPVDKKEMLLFLALCNSPDTAAGYASALYKCSRVIDAPFDADWKKINDIVNGLKRMAGPKRKVCAILSSVMFKILQVKSITEEERCMLATVYCYLLRLGHEGVGLCR